MVQSSEFKADVEDDALGKVYVVSTLHFFWIKADVLALTDEDWHAFEGNFYIVIPFPAIESLACEEIYPHAFRKVEVASVVAVHDGTYQERVAKVVFVINMPACTVVGMVHE